MNGRATRWFLGAGLLLAAGVVAAQPMGGPMGGAPMGRGMGVPMGRWWERPKVVEQLNLTADQTQRLEAITLDQARTMVDLKGAVEKAEIELRAASDAEPFNARRVRDAFGVLIQARTKLETQRFEMLLKTREVLTADQWRTLRDLLRERRMEKGKGGPPAGEDPGRGPGGWDE
ncbi:MAG: periplasmic heavy metal sensor [Thermoanaerobaculaceae bacterium]|nr:periplasmic heavy metal sensor [Thermoanaerobaculaceae bacterium]